eukprot:6174054-Pleurochrysis_carterae.AAC.1
MRWKDERLARNSNAFLPSRRHSSISSIYSLVSRYSLLLRGPLPLAEELEACQGPVYFVP